MAINDLYSDGIAKGWQVHDASSFRADQQYEADVIIVGSGAGGGTSAELLSAAGLKVLMLEEGGLYTAKDFKKLDEFWSYNQLYQEGAGRATSDGGIGLLQGRAVGGTTLVNWTTSIRTPAKTLAHWAQVAGLKNASEAEMAPWFERAEQRLGVAPWAMAPNANNGLLRDGCEKLGWHWKTVPRNVRGCWNLGYCGFGCPTNAKQSMLVTTIPAALDQGMVLLHHARAQRLLIKNGRVEGIEALALDPSTRRPSGVKLQLRARHYVLAGGAINTPALLLRSKAPDPKNITGGYSCVHPVNLSVAEFAKPVEAFHGAPQSIYSDHFLWPEQGVGYKLEAAPLQPMLAASVISQHGQELAETMAKLPNAQATIALVRDGFVEGAAGGRVRVDDQGEAVFDYDIQDTLWNTLRQAYLTMAELQFAAGAQRVRPIHMDAQAYGSWAQAREAIAQLPMKKQRATVVSAHLMGGCAMGENRERCLVDSYGHHHELENLSIFDGSMFPTSIGANPQLSIYAFVTRNATRLLETLKA